jgi:hypothetical protein
MRRKKKADAVTRRLKAVTMLVTYVATPTTLCGAV